MIPFDKQSPFKGSGVRLGTPAVTTRGFGVAEMDEIASCIDDAMKAPNDAANLARVLDRVAEFLFGRISEHNRQKDEEESHKTNHFKSFELRTIPSKLFDKHPNPVLKNICIESHRIFFQN